MFSRDLTLQIILLPVKTSLTFWLGGLLLKAKIPFLPRGLQQPRCRRAQAPRGTPSKLGGNVPLASQTFTLFMTKIYDIPYPVYDPWPKIRKPILTWPLHQNLFQTCVIISCLIQTNYLNIICEGLLLIFFSIMMKKWLLKNWWWKSGFLKTYSSYQG